MSNKPEFNTKLNCIVCEVWNRGYNQMLSTFKVNHNTHEGRRATAMAARQAMLDGNLFVSYSVSEG